VTVIVAVTVIVTVTVAVKMVVIVVVTVVLHLYFRAVGQGKERGLYPPSGWIQRIKELDIVTGYRFGTCLVEACVGDVGHLVERCPWYMIHVRGSGYVSNTMTSWIG
jgi:hypothetical protein